MRLFDAFAFGYFSMRGGAMTAFFMTKSEPVVELASLLEAAPAPSPFLDARLRAWAGLRAAEAPTSGLDAADAFCQLISPGTTWVLKGNTGESSATITGVGPIPCTVLFTGRGTRPALALLAAFVRACDGARERC
jgi:hypothetical protein